ncbi:ABC transporter permease [Cellulomonas chengniuliangii]|uniref:Oligopeptide transport system permease protein OppC n=1 Tax=Cellulomonas chengniuliangii TaxID=2968084 RepID=A0ABY5L2N3_9CELL|nr:ABC transporter permease [Cellulomonas chengniuliangii]MCC2307054.1 ABC transporter permease [Cellulomonas chengniuliangii]MCC2316437.1 ABC transporter permease [Cellulomonas chengniuliangii]UUI76143.1 ABC transporter permease [Cellulomonas chengniuliangii]
MSTPPSPTPRGTFDETPAEEVVENAIELREVEGLSQNQIVLRRFFRHRAAVGAMVVLVGIVLLAFTSIGVGPIPGWWSFTPNQTGPLTNPGGSPTMSLPTWLGGSGFAIGEHPFGQDEAGRDVFARVMRGTQTSLIVMVVVGLVASMVGILVGALAGYYRGALDSWLMRFTDLVITIPVLVLGAILGSLAAGAGGAYLLAIFLGLASWTTLARLVRGEFLSLREREFVDAARVAGASDRRIIFKHMLPNSIGVIIVNQTLLMSSAILLETALSFVGLGIRYPNVSLGQLINQYQEAFATRPWLFWWPGLLIVTIALTVNFIGDGLRDAFDPRQKRIPSQRKMDRAAARAARSTGSASTGSTGSGSNGAASNGAAAEPAL